MFGNAPDNLYLELRCIHPDGKPPRTFWSKVGDKMNLVKAFNRAKQANADGYGVYFAPCLRREKVGKAESTAVLPALWVDIDCDAEVTRYNAAYDKLNGFELKPSAIVDSGGGVHAYWFMAEAVMLDESARDKAAAILRGLSEALGGDNHYVKSVASVMRLPGSRNTKSERNNAAVTVLQLEPDRRYNLDQFAWLESKPPKVERVGGIEVVTLNGNHQLPARTETYLASGASEGSRNHELFAAACQLRDAGYSESEAAGQLVARHVTSGSSEREAVATIRSAYSRPPREPIHTSREKVSSLVERYGRRDKQEQPSAEEIRQVVQACADLDPLAWAEERTRIRQIVGDTFRVDDLNRMYKHAKREQERGSSGSVPAAGRYLDTEAGIAFEKMTERGVLRQPVTDWSGRITEWVTRVDDDGIEEHIMRTHLQHPMHTTTLDIPGELFGDANGLGRFIAQRAGGVFTVYPAMYRHLPHAIKTLSADFPRRTTYRFLGWTQHKGEWCYLSPGLSVNAGGTLAEPPEVELETRLRDYGLRDEPWEDSLAAFSACASVFPSHLAGPLTAFAMLPLVQRFFPPAAPRPALHLVGTTGSGKSEIAALMTSFYGQFSRDTPPAQWGDTVNTVEVLGYAVADGLFWVDDWKPCYADEKTFTRFLQSYSRGMGRGRLTREAKLRQEKACRGLLLSTGESTMEGEASILSRMIVLDVPPWERRDPEGRRLRQAEALRPLLPGFTAHWARWVASQVGDGTFAKVVASIYEAHVKAYRELLTKRLGKQANTGRVIGNWAALRTVYDLIKRFLKEQSAESMLPAWQDSIVETAKAVQEERAGQVFIDTLGQLIASGDVRLIDVESTEEVRPGAPIVGYLDHAHVYLLPEISLREVKPTQSLNFTTKSIGDQLRDEGWLLPSSTDERLTIQRRFRGHRAWVWCLKREVLDGEMEGGG
jgi:hypothetical protein